MRDSLHWRLGMVGASLLLLVWISATMAGSTCAAVNRSPTPTRPSPPPLTPTVTPSPTQVFTPTPDAIGPGHAHDRSRERELGAIELWVDFDATWLMSGVHWRELWTIVQWQDGHGDWHDVEGWQGGLDSVTSEVGKKTWWFAKDLFGQGPFRWLIYQGPGGSLLVESEAFYLPYDEGIKRIDLELR